ncbi:DUF3895 domain-containing protein [Halalkalibacter kiskunsagensis]|uniref:DUF3895 domain-containing protein n=1 Tax=Halalkalibacter kiskunsagensis TaxID=1548599 RepID=A0ABV6KDZ6_9BACI
MLSYKEKELIKDYLIRNNFFTLIDLCNYLIDNGSSTAKYSTGKFHIYPYVAVFLETYVTSSALEIKQLENNIQYKIIGELSINNERKDNKENKDKEKIIETGQLSLF